VSALAFASGEEEQGLYDQNTGPDRIAKTKEVSHADCMDGLQRDRALELWRCQELAQFARRAHAQLGRGFVIVDHDTELPVYVTEVLGAPQPLIDEVYSYDPNREALIVFAHCDEDAITISRVKINQSL
jgi:hypothetical protein